jgi:iron(II)-dependent oxidoreductase
MREEAARKQKEAEALAAKVKAEDERRGREEAAAKEKHLAALEKAWKATADTANMTKVSANSRLGMLQAFVDKFKKTGSSSNPKGYDNPHEAEAKDCVANIKKNPEGGCSGVVASAAGTAGLEWLFSKPAGIYFAKTETTVAQYQACVKAGFEGCTEPGTVSDNKYCNWGSSREETNPINCVDWNQATAFCSWAGGRLPMEQEWEAEAGARGQYPWGSQEVTCDYAVWGDGAKTDGCGRDSTWPVCSKTRGNSVSGMCDMSGNVWEWTSSDYDSNSKVLRGGSWNYHYTYYLRASDRGGHGPTYGDYYGGFRCVRD